jgi:hypothetical protein
VRPAFPGCARRSLELEPLSQRVALVLDFLGVPFESRADLLPRQRIRRQRLLEAEIMGATVAGLRSGVVREWAYPSQYFLDFAHRPRKPSPSNPAYSDPFSRPRPQKTRSPCTLDVRHAAVDTIARLPRIQSLRDDLVEQLPGFDLDAIDRLGSYALAAAQAYFVHQMSAAAPVELAGLARRVTERPGYPPMALAPPCAVTLSRNAVIAGLTRSGYSACG